jgi:hypothetical protein
MHNSFTQEERDVVIRLISDVKINALDQNAIPLVSILQAIAKKVFALTDIDLNIIQPQVVDSEVIKPMAKKVLKKVSSDPSSF